MLLKRILKMWKEKGFLYLINKFYFVLTYKPIKIYKENNFLFHNLAGLEVGGPSGVFREYGLFPIYKYIKELDGCNFATYTIWEGTINKGKNFNYYKNKFGYQFVSEATDLNKIENHKYDFVISSNCLEHIANPLKALKEWIRVTQKGGLILLVLPNKDFCFDKNRKITLFSHLLEDYIQNTDEKDLTHLDEILADTVFDLDTKAGSKEDITKRNLNNFETRAMHHHVFDISLLIEIYNYLEIEVLGTYSGKENIILGKIKK